MPNNVGMGRSRKVYQCEVCGAEILRQTRREGPKLCLEHAAARVAEAARALHSKDTSSPVYQRWLRGCSAAAHRTAQG